MQVDTRGPHWAVVGLARIDLGVAVWIGLIGSVTVAAGSVATGRLAPTPGVLPLLTAQQAPHVRGIGQVLLVAGLLTMSLAWAALGRLVHQGSSGTASVIIAALVWAAPLLLVPPAFSGDVWSYVANGMIAAHGLSPYSVSPERLSGPIIDAVSARWRDAPAPYGALPLVWGAITMRLTSSLWAGLYSFRLLACAGLGLLTYSVLRLARLTGHEPAIALWLVLASPFTLVHGIAGAHVDVLLAGFAATAVLASLRGRPVLGTLMLGCATAVKVTALLYAVPLALALVITTVGGGWARVRAAALVATGALATAVGLGLASGVGVGWVAGLRSSLSVRSPLSVTTQLGLVVARLSGVPEVALAQALGSIVVAGSGLWFLLRPGDVSPARVVSAGGLTTAIAVLLSPVVHFWYFFWCLPLLAAVPLGHVMRRTLITTTLAFGLLAPFDASQRLPNAATWQVLGMAVALLVGLGPQRLLRPPRGPQRPRNFLP